MKNKFFFILFFIFCIPLALWAGFQDAEQVNFNTEITKSFLKGTDIRFYKVILPENGDLKREFRHDYIDTTYYKYTMEIIDETNYVYQKIASSGVDANILKGVSLSAGNYYLKVYMNGDMLVNKPYTFIARFETGNFEIEKNDSFQMLQTFN